MNVKRFESPYHVVPLCQISLKWFVCSKLTRAVLRVMYTAVFSLIKLVANEWQRRVPLCNLRGYDAEVYRVSFNSEVLFP